jgi:hypothetical protein
MLRAWKLFWIALWSILVGALITRNVIRYKDQPFLWCIGKSVLDTVLVVFSALFLTPFLVAMNVSWIVSFFDKKWAKLVIGTISGIVFGLLAGYAIEVLVLFGIFSVDIKTGPDKGIINRWRQVKDQENRTLIAA